MYSLDGLPLDDPQGRWYLHDRTGLRIMPARTVTGASLPGRDGVLASLGSAFTPGFLPLTVSVNRSTHAELMESVEFLNGVFGQRHKLMSLVHDYGDGQKREAMVEIVSQVEPEKLTLELVRLDVQCRAPSVFWRDLATVDATANITASTATTTLGPLAGTTGAINDALLRFKGGFSTATVTDPVSGDQITINAALAGTEYLVVDTANWTARKHTTDSWSTTAGVNTVTSVVSNRGSGPMLALNPDFTTGAGRVRLQVKGVNVTGSPTVEVRAKRSFL